ncbi:hypothetical protein B566_EDAN010237 [Ephemera danica]|nr:hypothetical protein B566_EDAN010237 [Ephemera danica]
MLLSAGDKFIGYSQVTSSRKRVFYLYRGIVVVFNHEKFDFDLEPRAGTTKDADRLQAAFKSRGFLVLPTFNDKSHAEIKSILGKASKVKREAYGSVLIFALSHGLDGGQIAARDKFYSASDLREPFLDNPAFKDKPLIFVHQATTKRNLLVENLHLRTKMGTSFIPDKMTSFSLSRHLRVGHKSYRHKTEGSFYIQKMCDILEKNNDIEILDLLTAANCSVIDSCAAVKEKMETFDKVQTATFKSTLLKRFFLRTNEAELNSISDKRQTPVECYVPQPECQYRGAAIIFHDENHKSEAIEFLESMKELNFSCQPVDHEPSDRDFLHSFAAHLRTSKGSDVIASVRFAQRNTSQEIHRPCNVIMSSTLRFRIDCSKEMLVHDDNALKVSSVFSYHVRDPVANFQHRTKELEIMCNVLQSNASKMRRFSINMWLSGFGGLGKSQTVMKYIQNALLTIAVALANEKMKSCTSPSDVIEDILKPKTVQNIQKDNIQKLFTIPNQIENIGVEFKELVRMSSDIGAPVFVPHVLATQDQSRFADALRMCENAILIFNDNNFTLASDVLKIEYMKATILIAKEKFGEAHIILQDVKQRVQN